MDYNEYAAMRLTFVESQALREDAHVRAIQNMIQELMSYRETGDFMTEWWRTTASPDEMSVRFSEMNNEAEAEMQAWDELLHGKRERNA